MDYESRLLSKAVQSGGLENLIASGISLRHFNNPQNEELWGYLLNHVDKYKTQPSFEEVKDNFKDYEFEVVTDSFDYVKDKFIAQLKRREATAALFDLGEIIDSNNHDELMNIDELFLDRSRDLANILPTTKAAKFSSMKDRIAQYKRDQELGVQNGMPFGIPSLDKYTLGLMDYEHVVVAGPTGLGKTTLGLYLQLNHFFAGYTPMIISLEMSDEEIYKKLDGMAADLKQQAIQAMTLGEDEMGRWEAMADKIDRLENDIIVIDVDNATPEKIYAEASRWNPDVIMVDYIQLLDAPRHIKESYKQIGHISKQMKRIARQLKIPVYGLSQTNSESFTEGAKLGNVSESRAITHNADIVLGLHQDEEMEPIQKLELRILKNRRGQARKKIQMLWDHENSDYREWKPEDEFRELNDE